MRIRLCIGLIVWLESGVRKHRAVHGGCGHVVTRAQPFYHFRVCQLDTETVPTDFQTKKMRRATHVLYLPGPAERLVLVHGLDEVVADFLVDNAQQQVVNVNGDDDGSIFFFSKSSFQKSGCSFATP